MRRSPGVTTERREAIVAARDALAAGLREHLPEASFRVPRGGLSLWCELPADLPSSSLAAAAEDEGLLVAAGPRFALDGGLDRWLRLPHVLPPETMAEAAARLGRAAERVRGGRTGRARPGRPLVA